MIVRVFRHPSGQRQHLVVGDLLAGDGDVLAGLVVGQRVIVYSDPPWSPGNEKWWRRHAGVSPPFSYEDFVSAWCLCVALCKPEHVFCEQSVNPRHRAYLVDAALREPLWVMPLLEEWVVTYGAGKAVRPNVLLHFGVDRLGVDISGLRGEAMTRTVFDALGSQDGVVVVDPCLGFGMSSRQAHEHGLDCMGMDLDSRRLDRAVAWLLLHGYEEVLT